MRTGLRSPKETVDHLTIEQRQANVSRLQKAYNAATHPVIKATYGAELRKARAALERRLGYGEQMRKHHSKGLGSVEIIPPLSQATI